MPAPPAYKAKPYWGQQPDGGPPSACHRPQRPYAEASVLQSGWSAESNESTQCEFALQPAAASDLSSPSAHQEALSEEECSGGRRGDDWAESLSPALPAAAPSPDAPARPAGRQHAFAPDVMDMLRCVRRDAAACARSAAARLPARAQRQEGGGGANRVCCRLRQLC